MMNRKNKTGFLLVFFIWIGCYLFSHQWEVKHFFYGNVSARQQIHVYYPEPHMRTGINSCAVHIQGGGWRGHQPAWGDEFSPAATTLLNSGFIVVYIDFRPTREESFWPAQGNDWEAALRFLENNCEDIGINPNNISGWGHSSGGHGIQYLREKGWLTITVIWATISDLTILPDFWPGLFGPGYDTAEYFQKAKEASPLYMVNQPPPITYTLQFHGSHDNMVPKEQSELMYQALEINNHHVDYIEVKNAGHSFRPYMEGVEVSLSQPEIEEITAAYIIETVRELKQSRVKSAIIRVEKKINRALLRTEYCNLIFFENNPQNIEKNIDVVEYRVYRKFKNESAYVYLVSLNTSAASFLDRNLSAGSVDDYTYYVTCVGRIEGENIESKIDPMAWGNYRPCGPLKASLTEPIHQEL